MTKKQWNSLPLNIKEEITRGWLYMIEPHASKELATSLIEECSRNNSCYVPLKNLTLSDDGKSVKIKVEIIKTVCIKL